MEVIANSTDKTKKLAYEIAKKIKEGYVIALYGDLGSINHVDLYRLSSKEEVLEIGLEEMMQDKKSITIIEWPEIVEKLLPTNTVKIYFDYIDEKTRKITIKNLH